MFLVKGDVTKPTSWQLAFDPSFAVHADGRHAFFLEEELIICTDGGIFTAPIAFNIDVAPHNIVEYKGVFRGRPSHVDHINKYFFSYSYNVNTGLFVANLKGVHIPEPSILAIFTIGMFGLASRRFKKQF
jgi:hypothetical protein